MESVIADEPDQLLHVAQLLRDRRESAAALAALIAELEAEGKTLVEDAGHYATEENLYVSAAKRADGEPATDEVLDVAVFGGVGVVAGDDAGFCRGALI